MDNGNVAQVTRRHSAVYFFFKIWQIARKSNRLYFPWITILSVKFR